MSKHSGYCKTTKDTSQSAAKQAADAVKKSQGGTTSGMAAGSKDKGKARYA